MIGRHRLMEVRRSAETRRRHRVGWACWPLALCLTATTVFADEGPSTRCAAPAMPACLSERPADAACNAEVERYRRSADAYRICLTTEYRDLTDKPRGEGR